MEFHIIDITYTALHIIAHARTNRKEDIFMQRRLYIDEATRRWTYSALRYFYRKNKAEVSTFLLNVALLKRKIANGPVHPAWFQIFTEHPNIYFFYLEA